MKIYLFAAVVISLLTLTPALLQGTYVHRWRQPAEQLQAASHLDQLPQAFGRWRMIDEGEPLSEAICRELGLSGNLKRTYVDPESGESFDLLLMVGNAGRLVRHPPNICYGNRANQQVGGIETIETEGEQLHSLFRLLEYRRPAEPLNPRFTVAFGFSTGQEWDSPQWPRMKYGGEPMLYKMQVLTSINGDEREAALKSQQAFLNDFVQEFAKWHADLVANADADADAK